MTFALLLEERGLAPASSQAPDIYCVIGGDAERGAAFADIHRLRAGGYRVEYPMRDIAFGKQFKAAADSGAQDRAHLRRRRDREGASSRCATWRTGPRGSFPAAEVEAAVRGFFGAPLGEVAGAEGPGKKRGEAASRSGSWCRRR